MVWALEEAGRTFAPRDEPPSRFPSSAAGRMAAMPETSPRAAPASPGLPAWCDVFLDPPDGPDFFASRCWYDTLLQHGLPPGARAVPLAPRASVMLPMMRHAGRQRSLTTLYTIGWRPLPARGASPAELQAAGLVLGGTLRRNPPVALDALDPEAPGLTPLLQGIADAGLSVLPHDHFGNWHEPLAEGAGWDGYLAGRDPALRATILRKTPRTLRQMSFELHSAPGPDLDGAIAAYEEVRGRSWKPQEPFPRFDAALMRATAAAGTLRLGLLRNPDGTAAAVQYWIVSGGNATLLKLVHDEARRAASPGTVLTARMIAGLIEEDRVRDLDFGRGDDPYKVLWVSRRRQRIGLTIADPLHPAGALAIARHLAGRLRRRLLRAAS